VDKDQVLEALKKVYDPEYPMPITDLRIVEKDDITITDDTMKVEFKPTAPYCPMGGVIGIIIKYALEKKFGKNVDVKVKTGSHAQESTLNQLLSDRKKYEETVERLKSSGMLERCITE
jgi:metal-sulfur cluster biosynthetic enzyme